MPLTDVRRCLSKGAGVDPSRRLHIGSMQALQRSTYRRIAELAGAFVLWHWPELAAAQGREWGLSVGPQVGQVWLNDRLTGTVKEDGQFSMIDADSQIRAASWGVSAALTRRFWWEGDRTAWGPIVALSYIHASDAQVAITPMSEHEQAAADRLERQLSPRVQLFLAQAGVGLTMFGGWLEGRLLVGGQFTSASVPEFDASQQGAGAMLAGNLGLRVRLPVAATWRGFVGGHCGAFNAPLSSSPGAACAGELGVEWVFPR